MFGQPYPVESDLVGETHLSELLPVDRGSDFEKGRSIR